MSTFLGFHSSFYNLIYTISITLVTIQLLSKVEEMLYTLATVLPSYTVTWHPDHCLTLLLQWHGTIANGGHSFYSDMTPWPLSYTLFTLTWHPDYCLTLFLKSHDTLTTVLHSFYNHMTPWLLSYTLVTVTLHPGHCITLFLQSHGIIVTVLPSYIVAWHPGRCIAPPIPPYLHTIHTSKPCYL